LKRTVASSPAAVIGIGAPKKPGLAHPELVE
jgi:hypothetical protein